jgi:hypothetical protein
MILIIENKNVLHIGEHKSIMKKLAKKIYVKLLQSRKHEALRQMKCFNWRIK